MFGAGSSAYQIEGAANEDGRGPSIWDYFTRTYPGKIRDGTNGDVSIDSYHRYKEDVGIMKGIGLDAYRFSISWPRILPHGNLSGGVNWKGINYYNNLIDELKNNSIEPYVTLFHWDVPQGLEELYGGFLSPLIVADFRDYADLCFKSFGNRVKKWVTLNEPLAFSHFGYDSGDHPPGRCSSWMQNNCTGGDSSTEPYIVSHNQLLAHAAAVKLYKEKYQAEQKGKIGITLHAIWPVLYSNSSLDRRALGRSLDFQLGWFMSPIVNGEYPLTMRSLVRERLPNFSANESEMLKGSYDFIGINYYVSLYVKHDANYSAVNLSSTTDVRVNFVSARDGVLLGEQLGSMLVYPRGIWQILLYIKRKYNNPVLYVMENGYFEYSNASLFLQQSLNDNFRIKYHYQHLAFTLKAIKNGVNLKGYFVWALMDSFEWVSGHTIRFGINYVDFNDGNLNRYPKLSSQWFKNFLQK
ncbi:beta-glucosidase 24-like [Cornus florida]|uniref:beta-glucosidase 24-like n=1 Tax=Cornus florida TaxID=4283 RepID=UPI0028985597|nr:beta-glucosidase 24-like [Cornus florida]